MYRPITKPQELLTNIKSEAHAITSTLERLKPPQNNVKTTSTPRKTSLKPTKTRSKVTIARPKAAKTRSKPGTGSETERSGGGSAWELRLRDWFQTFLLYVCIYCYLLYLVFRFFLLLLLTEVWPTMRILRTVDVVMADFLCLL